MKFKFPEIDAKTFYLVGKYAFFTIGLIGMIRVVDLWTELKSYDIFSSIANVIFYLVLSGFFAKLAKEQDVAELNDEDLFKMSQSINQISEKSLKGGDTNASISTTRKQRKSS